MMVSSDWPDLWSIAVAEGDPSDARATLLRLHAELFVGAPIRDRETIETFEAIALGFLPHVDMEAFAAMARLLAPCADTPVSVLDLLAQRYPETREIVVTLAPRLPRSIIDLLLGSDRERVALAGRPDLDDDTLARLLSLHDPALDKVLAANLALAPTDEAFMELVERARRDAALARVLLSRPDLAMADSAALYLAAGIEQRTRIRATVAASALFQQPHLSFRLSAARVDELLAAAKEGDVGAFEVQLTNLFGLPSETEWRVLEAGRKELLALALRALGVEEEEATRVFLTLHPALSHSVSDVFALVRLIRTVARPTALALVEAIVGSKTAFARSGRHQPAMDPSGTPSLVPAAQSDRVRRTSDERQRARG
jgi:hypothetical protein